MAAGGRAGCPLRGAISAVLLASVGAGVGMGAVGCANDATPVVPSASASSASGATSCAASSSSVYTALTLTHHPVLTVFGRPGAGCGSRAVAHGDPLGTTSLPDGEQAMVFDGASELRVASAPELSISTTGELTLQAWIRPSTLTFRNTESSGYVNWLGKGSHGQFEYCLRMYSAGNTEGRANRLSAYVFNRAGGLGSGAYVQDPLSTNAWLFVTVVYTTRATADYAANTVNLLVDGVLRDSTPFSQFHVTPTSGDAPLRIGTMDGRSWFQGAIGAVAVFPTALPVTAVAAQDAAMRG